MRKRSAMFFISDVYLAVSTLMVEAQDHDEIEFIEAAIHRLEKELKELKAKTEKEQKDKKELYEELWGDLRAMYQRDIAMADNGIPFMDRIETFIQELKKPEPVTKNDNIYLEAKEAV
jgi:hypothetical protein